ncbi:MAG: NUDIX hydrolase [Candidatus Heimdallarchaeota archaeon]|nr:MAG: NUDIX hydrolase [Candidatus Heimdallarchaeota archaeon]
MGNYEEILWEGRIPLSSVIWTFDPNKTFKFSPLFEEQRQQIWNAMCKTHPHLYDGQILILNDFSFEKNILKLNTWTIRFSCIQVFLKKNLEVPKFGGLGFQAIITDPTYSYLLIGERAHTSEYKPGYKAIPGGIFEESDSKKSLLEACLRELKEEIQIDVNPESFFIIAMVREASKLGTCLIIEVETREDVSQQSLYGNDEWESNQLEWIEFSQVFDLKHKHLTEGLHFLRSKLIEKNSL